MSWFPFALIALVIWGLFGFFPKLATQYIDARSILIFQVLGRLMVTLLVLASIRFRPEVYATGNILAILAGVAGTSGSLFFFYSLDQGKASVVVTMTALYPLVTIILSFLILKERFSMRQGMGLVLALVAMVLFSG